MQRPHWPVVSTMPRPANWDCYLPHETTWCLPTSGSRRADDPAQNHLAWRLALPDFLGEGIAQSDGPVQHQTARRGVRVADEIALPLELHGLARIDLRGRWLDPGALQDFP